MDHSEAARIKAVEKYILGELPPELRDQFEEHYFDCPECASDIRALARLRNVSRLVLEEEDKAAEVPSAEKRPRRGWFPWLRPVFGVSAIVLLAAIVIFEETVTIPALKKRAGSQSVAQVYESSFRVQGTTRGENASKVSIRPGQSFALDFDFTPSRMFTSYKGVLVDASGTAIETFDIPGEEANKELHLVFPGAKVHAGSYDLIFSAVNGASLTDPRAGEVQRISFIVEVHPQ
jgi:Putative zinc-finger